MKEYLTVPQIAKKLNTSKSVIYKWASNGSIPHYKIGGLVRFDEEKIEKWLKKKEIKGE